MTRTLLIVIGIACALVTAAGIMWYNYNDPVNFARRHLRDIYHFEAFCILSNLEIKTITNLLNDNDPMVRSTAISILGNRKAKESIPDITKLLQDNVPDVRESAVIALMEFDAKEDIPEIKKLLKDETEDVRRWAEFALKKLGVSDEEIQKIKEGIISDKILGAVKEIEKTNLVMADRVGYAGSEPPKEYITFREEATNEELKELTSHANAAVRCSAIQALSKRDGIDFFPIIMEHLDDTASMEVINGCLGLRYKARDYFIGLVYDKFNREQQIKIESLLQSKGLTEKEIKQAKEKKY